MLPRRYRLWRQMWLVVLLVPLRWVFACGGAMVGGRPGCCQWYDGGAPGQPPQRHHPRYTLLLSVLTNSDRSSDRSP
jgi:hypothetical protein